MIATSQDWFSRNHAQLTDAIADLKALLRRHAEIGRAPVEQESEITNEPRDTSPSTVQSDAAGNPLRTGTEAQTPTAVPPTALDRLTAAFGLSAFERALVLLCAAAELDSSVAALCAAAQGEPSRNYPTFSLALAALPNAHWSALAPEAPLRRWRLVEISGTPVTTSPLRIDERVLHFLTGTPGPDERLAAMIEPVAPAGRGDLAASHAEIAAGVVAALSQPREHPGLPAVQLCCAEPRHCRPLAAAIAGAVGARAVALSADFVPLSASELEAFLRLWERESVLSNFLLVLECDGDADDARARQLHRIIERLAGPLVIASREPFRVQRRATIVFHVARPTVSEQRAAWRAVLAPGVVEASPADALAAQFNLGLPAIRAIASEALAWAAASPDRDAVAQAWQTCRSLCRARLDGLAQRIEPAAGWDDLVLPEPQLQTLRQIAIQVRHRAEVYESWGFAAKSARGLGISALFSGVSGAGKTMAAEILAAELRLDLYRIDLASVVSKYIGETEKNLRRVFDGAEESGAILLFDEADALFGKRSEVKDSHDRYANIEVSYLLQRMESYRGLAILTTNLKGALDPAFLRRLRFVVQFPFPDPPQRAEIWRRIFPRATPTGELDFHKLSRLNIPGGNIRNIAMNAAFLAAADGRCVRMPHLLAAARAEYGKLERVLTDAEVAGWT